MNYQAFIAALKAYLSSRIATLTEEQKTSENACDTIRAGIEHYEKEAFKEILDFVNKNSP